MGMGGPKIKGAPFHYYTCTGSLVTSNNFDSRSARWIKKHCLQQQSKIPCEFDEPSLDDFAFESEVATTENSILDPPPMVEFDYMASIHSPGMRKCY